MTPLRDYQSRAVDGVVAHARAGVRRVCLVAPTGSGKTRMGMEVVRRAIEKGKRVLWVCHRNELVDQAIEAARHHVGVLSAGIVRPGPVPSASLLVATVQTLVNRDPARIADVVVWDECHHSEAQDWKRVLDPYDGAHVVGLTATPERGDGAPLGDTFGALVVAAQYSELMGAGHLVPCKVIRPDRIMDGQDLAADPVESYLRFAPGKQGFLFASLVSQAQDLRERFVAAGVPAAVIEASTPKQDRDAALRAFKAGALRLLLNVFVLTEGVDVPAAEVCILARRPGHASTYLQMVGRVLRPAPGKTTGLLIDLCGASWKHGMPGSDLEYSLDGKAIRPAGQSDGDGEEGDGEASELPTIHSLALREVYAGEDTPAAAKQEEWERLRDFAKERGWDIGWAAREYRKLFKVPPPSDVDDTAQRDSFRRLIAQGRSKGYKAGWAAAMFKARFGDWPPRHWSAGT